MSLEIVTTSDRRSSDSSTALIYWRSSSSSTSLLIDSVVISKWWKDIDRIIVSCKSRCLEFMTTSDRRSSDSSTALIYWESSSSSTSLLITTSRASIYVSDRKHMRTIRIVVISSRLHSLLSIRAKHQTTAIARLYQQLIQRLRDTSQEQNRILWYNHTLSSHRVHFSFITYFFVRWMTIIEQKNSFQHYNHEHHECKEIVFAIEDRDIVV